MDSTDDARRLLGGTLQALSGALSHLPDLDAGHLGGVGQWFGALSALGSRGTSVDLAEIPPSVVAHCLDDAQELLVLIPRLMGASPEEEAVAQSSTLARRLMSSLSADYGPAGVQTEPVSEADVDPGGSAAKTMAQIAMEYGTDAVRERRATLFLYGISGLLVCAGVGFAILGIHNSQSANSDVDFAKFAAHAGVGAVVLLVAGLLGRRAVFHAAASAEAVRLQRQLVGFDAYVSTLPPTVRDVVRAAMVQRLFPRLLTDDDPMREPRWPDSSVLLDAVQADGHQPDDQHLRDDQAGLSELRSLRDDVEDASV